MSDIISDNYGWPLGDVYMIAGYSKKGRMNMLAEILKELETKFELQVHEEKYIMFALTEKRFSRKVMIAQFYYTEKRDVMPFIEVYFNKDRKLEIELTYSNQILTSHKLRYLLALQERIDYWNENLVL